MGVRKFQDLIGRTEFLKVCDVPQSPKAALLDFSPILKKATDLRPNVSILGGTVKQDFQLHKRLVSIYTVLQYFASLLPSFLPLMRRF